MKIKMKGNKTLVVPEAVAKNYVLLNEEEAAGSDYAVAYVAEDESIKRAICFTATGVAGMSGEEKERFRSAAVEVIPELRDLETSNKEASTAADLGRYVADMLIENGFPADQVERALVSDGGAAFAELIRRQGVDLETAGLVYRRERERAKGNSAPRNMVAFFNVEPRQSDSSDESIPYIE